jgi:hypothetical protein
VVFMESGTDYKYSLIYGTVVFQEGGGGEFWWVGDCID